MVIYVRVHKVRMEYIKGVDVCNVVWQHPNTVFWQKMSPSCNAFQRYHLDWSTCLCTFWFDGPHASIRVTLIRSGHKPAHESALNLFSIFIGLEICEQEQKANSGNVPLVGAIYIMYSRQLPWGILISYRK